MKTYITKSKAGHYTVTVRGENGKYLASAELLPNLQRARVEAERIRRELGA
jgi:uncharacterized protein YegP (UPF0339 family)